MRRRRNAFIGALVWWFGRRYARKRAARALSAVPGVGGSSGAVTRGRLARVGAAFAVVGALAAGLVAWRKLRGPGEPSYPSAARARPEDAHSGRQ